MKKIPLSLATAMFAAATVTVLADGLTITPATLPDGMEQVAYKQTFTASGGSGSYSWYSVPWSMETAASTYAVGANETPLWDGAQSFTTNFAYRLPFPFPYCGVLRDTIWLNTRGWFYLEDGHDAPFYYPSNSSLGYGYNGIAALWTFSANVSGFVDTSVEGEVSFRFESDCDDCRAAYRLTLKSDGTIRLSYRQDENDTLNGNPRVIGLASYDTMTYYYDGLPVGSESDGIPTQDYLFTTYGLPPGLSFSSSYYDYETYTYSTAAYGTPRETGNVKFALRLVDNNDSSAVTNVYAFAIAENPDRPPVVEAFTPAATNTPIMLSVGQTRDFHVDVTDPAGGDFDVNWLFMSEDSPWATQRDVGSGTNFTFVATTELHGMQNSEGRSVLKCVVSDSFWTNSIVWKVYIRRDTYVDASADPDDEEADGTRDHPFASFNPNNIRKGDTIILSPGTYYMGYWSSPGAATIRSIGGNRANTRLVTPTGASVSGPYSGSDRLVLRGLTLEGSAYIRYADLDNCDITGISSSDNYAIQYCNLSGCYIYGNRANRYVFANSTLSDCTVAGNTISIYSSENSDCNAIGPSCTLDRTIVVNNLTLDGVERNWYDYNWSDITANDCCSIPAMASYGTGNYEAQPLFVCAAESDFRLRAGSPCLADDPADNTGAYKDEGIEGFVVHASCDAVRGTVSPAVQLVDAGGSATIASTAVTNRAFVGWATNGVVVAGAETPSLTIENIEGDIAVEALFEVRDVYVSADSGSDSNDGTEANPLATVATAAKRVLDGENIRLAPGIYESFDLATTSGYNDDNRALTILGAGADKTFIDGSGSTTCVRLGKNMTLRGVAVVNGYASAYAGGVSGGTIVNCVVSNCVAYGSYAGGVYKATVISSLIANNTNTYSSYYSSYVGGLYQCRIYNSTIVSNGATRNGTGGAYGCYLVNCIVTGNRSEEGGAIYGNDDAYECRTLSLTSTIDTEVAMESNLIGGDPMFLDAANGDYRLVAGSPAINAGENIDEISGTDAVDLVGAPRIQNGKVDYGCYEGGVVTGAPEMPVATA